MYEQLVKEVDLIVNEDAISFSDNLNPTFLRRVSDDFENRATKTYAKLYMDFSSQTGRAIEVFRKTLQENPSGNLNSLPLEKKKTHPMILDEYKYEYPDISTKLPEYLAKSAYIEEQTEEQFANYLKVKSLEMGGFLIPVHTPSGSAIAAVVQEKPATASDAISFVADFQNKSEKDFLAQHDVNSLKGLSPT